jgi:hypothetical protein
MGKTTRGHMLLVITAAVIAIAVGVAAPVLWARNGKQANGTVPFADAKIIIEVNSTDQDAGIQVFLGGDPWEKTEVLDPSGRKILDITGRGSVGQQDLAELFFESGEPTLDEVPLDEFLGRFPEGEYEFIGRSVEGDKMTGTATFIHDIPAGPVIVSPEEDAVLDPEQPVVVDWEPVTEQFTGPSEIEIVGYQVIVEEFSVDLPAAVTSVTVPPEFIEPGREYSFEVLVIEASGNQTISESAFSTSE